MRQRSGDHHGSDDPHGAYGTGLAGPGRSVLGHVTAVARYPVKSMVGENVDTVELGDRGVVGDRLWAVQDVDGKLGSGKSTRRFRRMDGLLDLVATYDGDLVPIVTFPDGRRIRGDQPEVHGALSEHVGRAVRLTRETDVSHFDEGPLHLLTTSAVDAASAAHGSRVDLRRLRANLVVDDLPAARWDGLDLVGPELLIGTAVVRVRGPMTRCVMVDLPQVGLPRDGQLLSTLARVTNTQLGLVVDVVSPGRVSVGDAVRTT